MVVLQRRELPDEDEDVRLWRSVQAGSDAAFEELVTRHSARLASVASRLLNNPADVEDVVQETFLRVFETRSRYPRVYSLRVWLLRITINLCHSRRRTAWWRRILLTHDYRESEAMGEDPQALAERGVMDGQIWNAVRELPETLRLPFLLRYSEELSGAEIAAVLNWNESTVWSRIYAARRQLRSRLGTCLTELPDSSA
jgi:RNA polymerase sigma-70 factor (ECF subfamily)